MRRSTTALLALGASLCLCLGAGAGSASAARTFNSNVNEGFSGANSVAFDASGDVWIADSGHFIANQTSRGQNGLYEMNPFPSQNLLEAPDTYPAWEFFSLAIDVAFDQSNGEVFASQANGREVDIFKNGVFDRRWTGINEVADCCPGDVHIAIDNSNGFSRGRVYLSLTSPENDIEALDAGQRPVDFPAEASYIKGNRLIGTPSGLFGKAEQISVDSKGNLYVADAGKGLLDEFDSGGTFLRSFPDPNASEGYPGAGGAAIDPTNGDVLLSGGSAIEEFDAFGNHLGTVPSSGGSGGIPAVDASGHLYAPMYGTVAIYNPAPPLAKVTEEPVSAPTPVSGTLSATVDPNGGGPVTECKFEYGTTTAYGGGSIPCAPGGPYGSTTPVGAGVSGLATGTTYHYRAVVKDANGTTFGEDQVYTPGRVLDLRTDAAAEISESGATLQGSFVGSGEDTHYYYEWGPTEAYGHTTASAPGADAGSSPGPGRAALPVAISGLNPYSTYHFRVVASNTGGGGEQHGADRTFTTTPGVPSGRNPSVTAVHSDRVELHGEVNPNGGDTVAKFEYVDNEEFEESGWANAQVAPAAGTEIGMGKNYQGISAFVDGLRQGTLYHYRAEGTNATGSGGVEATFRTFPFIPSLNDPCPNAHVRQQTGASLLLDCRAYELVSAANTGGYDVESSLVAGQAPFAGYPEAHRAPQHPGEEPQPQLLYGVHDGGIPGTGSPTNRGVDPYVATRTSSGWKTRYVGIPADDPYASAPFTSSLAEADPSLETFAFGGPEICSPCFDDGSTGTPIRRPDGELVQGMAGSVDPGPSAEPSGFVGRRFSADGTHFVFGSSSKFEPDGNEGSISIYDRDLASGQTHVVSKLPGGGNIACTVNCGDDGVGELDISGDGSRIVVGRLVSEEDGARYWQLYMNIGDSGETVDLTPGAGSGALYDGMTADGSKVFFTTVDQLLPADTDHSADLYEADVDGVGSVTLKLISTGTEGTGNSDACQPAANTAREHWNAIAAEENCGIVAIGGGGGVASRDGTVYFLSPEKLAGASDGVQNAPNLYVARPGSSPEFVATLESTLNAPLPASSHAYLRAFGAPISHVAGIAIDHATGDIYALDIGTNQGTGYVYKFDRRGHPVLGFGVNGRLTVGGMLGFYALPCEISVNNDPSSPGYGDIYVPSTQENIGVFDKNGGHVATINVPDTVTGTAVDQATGDLWASGYSGTIYRFDSAGKQVSSFGASSGATGLAVAGGKVYVVNGGGFGAKGTTEVYDTSGTHLEQLDGNPSNAVSIDESSGHIYVDEGNQATEFDAAGNEVNAPTGNGVVSASFGIGVDDGYVFMGNPSLTNVAEFAPAAVGSDPKTDNPVVLDSVSEPSRHRYGDFQVTPSGDFAAFGSTIPLSGYTNADHREVFRYDQPSDQIECVSCNPTSETATGDAALAGEGLGLTNDGRVFFNSDEGLVDRDLNEQEDAYEWEPQGFQAEYEQELVPGASCEEEDGCVQLISSGTALLGSKLLGATADGTDAFFFARDTLVSEDQNGNRVKVYDARTAGGFPQSPEPVPCKASDECHGPGSVAPPEPEIKSVAVTPGGNATETTVKCRGSLVKKHGKCVKKPKRVRHHRRHRHRGGSK